MSSARLAGIYVIYFTLLWIDVTWIEVSYNRLRLKPRADTYKCCLNCTCGSMHARSGNLYSILQNSRLGGYQEHCR